MAFEITCALTLCCMVRVGPRLCDLDSTHVPAKARARKEKAPPPLEVLPPSPVRTPRALANADLACVRVAASGQRQHVVHPLQSQGGEWCAVCAVCGLGGVKISRSLQQPCQGPPEPASHGARALQNLARTPARFNMNKRWHLLRQPFRTAETIRAGETTSTGAVSLVRTDSAGPS